MFRLLILATFLALLATAHAKEPGLECGTKVRGTHEHRRNFITAIENFCEKYGGKTVMTAKDELVYDTKIQGQFIWSKDEVTAHIDTEVISTTGGPITLDREECRSMLRIPIDKCCTHTEAKKYGGTLTRGDKVWSIELWIDKHDVEDEDED